MPKEKEREKEKEKEKGQEKVPLPPKEAGSTQDKQPGHTRKDLERLALGGDSVKKGQLETNGGGKTKGGFGKGFGKGASQSQSAPATPVIPSRAASVTSEASSVQSHKFTLKDLLASGPKLSRRSSARSASSRHSDSDREQGAAAGGGGRSVGGDSSAGSLRGKYGVCQKVAIGKGATSVVRLAHKWDRNDGDKMYAVKVGCCFCFNVCGCGLLLALGA